MAQQRTKKRTAPKKEQLAIDDDLLFHLYAAAALAGLMATARPKDETEEARAVIAHDQAVAMLKVINDEEDEDEEETGDEES